MADVKWIKITTTMFDDEKIKLIEAMPDRDTILIVWIKLLTQAGKCNASGYLLLNQNIPYTDEMLSAIFNRPISTVRMALEVFKNFGMIDIDDDTLHISNWEKHQNIEGMDKIREQNRERKQRQRQKEKQLLLSEKTMSRDSHGTSHQNHAIEQELELEKESTSSSVQLEIFSCYQKYIKDNNEQRKKDILYFLTKGVSKEVIMEAIKDSENANYPSKYALGILDNCLKDRTATIEQYNAKKKKAYEKKNENKGYTPVYREE